METPNQRVFIADCNQYPLQPKYNFTSPALRDKDGKVITKNGKVVRESNVAKAYREQYKAELKEQYGSDWKKVFYHGNYPSAN